MEEILFICWSITNSTFPLINHSVKISFTEDAMDKRFSDVDDYADGEEEEEEEEDDEEEEEEDNDIENEEEQSATLVGQLHTLCCYFLFIMILAERHSLQVSPGTKSFSSLLTFSTETMQKGGPAWQRKTEEDEGRRRGEVRGEVRGANGTWATFACSI